MSVYDHKAIESACNSLNEQNCYVQLISNEFSTDESLKNVEKWTEAKFSVEPIPENVIEIWKNAERTDFELPRPNPYLAESFDICDDEPSRKWDHVQKVLSEPKGELWFKGDGKFNLPRGIVSFFFRSNTTAKSPKTAAFKGFS